jgi:ribonuclease J
MADSTHKMIKIKPGDNIIFSSTPIPGNVKAVSKVMNQLAMKGGNVIFQDTHVSGHACQEELKLIYSLVQPKYVIPVHGEYKHLKAQAALANEMGIEKENIFILQAGNVLELSTERAGIIGQVKAKEIFIDGLGIGDIGNIVLRDRQYLSENGLIIVVAVIDKASRQVVSGPDVVSRGFIYVREADVLMEKIRRLVRESLDKCTDQNMTDSKIKAALNDNLNEFLWKELKRQPLILPIITEI